MISIVYYLLNVVPSSSESSANYPFEVQEDCHFSSRVDDSLLVLHPIYLVDEEAGG